MLGITRWIIRAFGAAMILAVLAVALGYYFASRSLPDYTAQVRVAGLSGPVEIIRDNYAVPHIVDTSDSDTIFGLGYVHAQDRLWQMMLMRRTARGRLSEIFGAETLPIDTLMRALDLDGVAARTLEYQRPEVVAELQAYADGVNAYLDEVRRMARGRGAPEFFLFSTPIARWQPSDSIAILKLLALQLTDAAQKEVLRAQLSLRLPPERLRDIMPEGAGPVLELPEFATLFQNLPTNVAGLDEPLHPLNPIHPVGAAGASNAWAATGARAAAGAPLLASDPHLGLNAPGIWMLARMEFAGGGAIGGTIPGLPGILIGRNGDLAWGLTSAFLDDQDFYIEALNPANPLEYRTPDGFAAFETRDDLITVKGGADVPLTLRWTRHGPVIPAPHFGVASITPKDHVAALAWTALSTDDRTIEAMLSMMRTRTVGAAQRLAALQVAPSQNLIVADRSTVALQAMGRAPARQLEHGSQGRIPSAGWIATNDWQGWLPFTDNPRLSNPKGGIVLNTNNQTTDAAFPRHWSFDWGDMSRIGRAGRLLGGREFHTLDSFIEAQTDAVSPSARILLPLMGRDLWFEGQARPEDLTGEQRQEALEALAAWNGEMSEHAPEPLIYSAWVRALQRRLIGDELGALAARLTNVEPIFLERVFRNQDGAGIWCDIAQSSAVETCPEMARLALDEALLELRASYGPRQEVWRWGAVHQALHKHSTLGDLPLLGWMLNIRQETPGGDDTLLRGRMAGTGPNPYLNTHASGYRQVVDFADPDASVFIAATGQSGHFLSRHYDDLSLLWRRGAYIPMALDLDRARAGALGVTMLRPAATP